MGLNCCYILFLTTDLRSENGCRFALACYLLIDYECQVTSCVLGDCDFMSQKTSPDIRLFCIK